VTGPHDATDARDVSDPTVVVTNLSKWFGQKVAVSEVSCSFGPGVTGLLGPNGAGKTTLLRVMVGLLSPSAGKATILGRDPKRHHGVYRHLGFVPEDEAVYNHMSARRFVEWSAALYKVENARSAAQRTLDTVQLTEDADRSLSGFSKGMRQRAKVAAALVHDPQVLILDEPTASLTETEASRLFELVWEARGRGIGVVYVTHRLKELYRLADRVTVLRDGQRVDTLDQSDVSEDRLLRLMTGRVIEQVFPDVDTTPEEVVLRVRDLTTATRSILNVDFEVRAGEIVGFAGLVGSGKSSAARACFGAEAVLSGAIELHRRDVTGSTPRTALTNSSSTRQPPAFPGAMAIRRRRRFRRCRPARRCQRPRGGRGESCWWRSRRFRPRFRP